MIRYSYLILFLLFTMLVMPSAVASIVLAWIIRGDWATIPIGIGLVLVGLLMTLLHRDRLLDIFDFEPSDGDKNDALQQKVRQIEERKRILRDRIAAQERDIKELEDELISMDQIREIHEQNIKQHGTLFDNTTRKIRSMLDLSDQLLVILRNDGTIEYVNRAFRKRLHCEHRSLEGVHVREFLVNEEIDFQAVHDRLYSGGDKPTIISVRSAVSGSQPEMISFLSVLLESGLYFLVCKAVNDELVSKSAILTKNREIEYINKINASLINNNGMSQLLNSIVGRIKSLFQIRCAAIYRIAGDQTECLAHSAADDEDYGADLSQMLNHPDFEQTVSGLDSPEPAYTMASTLLESEGETLKLVLIFDKEITNNEIAILRMFTNQASIVVQRDRIFEEMKRRFVGTVAGLVDIIEAKDKYTEGHSRRVQQLSVALARAMELSPADVEIVEIASILHDLGKIGIAQGILNKSGRLTPEEFREIQTHPARGYEILRNIDLDRRILDAVAYHHVRYDLRGYPKEHGLTAQPQFAGLIAVADAFDAMTSSRSYTKPRTMDEALAELKRYSGTQFMPEIVDAMDSVCGSDRAAIERIIH